MNGVERERPSVGDFEFHFDVAMIGLAVGVATGEGMAMIGLAGGDGVVALAVAGVATGCSIFASTMAFAEAVLLETADFGSGLCGPFTVPEIGSTIVAWRL